MMATERRRGSLAYAWLIFAVMALAYFLSYFLRSTNAVIATDLVRDLGISPGELGLMTSTFFLTFAAAQVPLGWALDRYGTRLVTATLMLAAVLGSVLFAVGDSLAVLAIGRGLIGLGMSGVLMGSLKAFSGWFPSHQFATVSGLFLGVGSLGAIVATTPLALMSANFGWRSVFWVGGVMVLLSALLIALVVRRAPGEDAQPASGADFSPLPVFRSIIFWRIALLGFGVTSSMFAFQSLWAGPYLTDRIGLDSLSGGNILFLLSVGVTSGYVFLGWIADRMHLQLVIVLSAAGLLLAEVVLAFFPPEASQALLAVLFFAFGFCASVNVLLFAHARRAFPLAMTGRAVTAVNLLGMGGSFLVQWLLGVLIEAFPRTATGGYPPVAYTSALLVLALIVGATLIYYLPLLRKVDA